MRSLIITTILSAMFLACGGDPAPGPTVPGSGDLPEAGAPSTPSAPATPATPAAPTAPTTK
jgi:hypothetical protein